MGWTAVGMGALAAATIGSAIISSSSQESAAEAQAEAARSGQDWQERIYYQNRADMAPWRVAGTEAVNKLAELTKAGPGEYEKSPYYDFLMEEGTKGLERGAAARGKQFSGEEAKALTKYGQNLASTDYDIWLNNWYKSLTPWQSLAGLGQTATAQTAQLGAQTGANISNTILAGGQAQAAGQLGQANTWANTLGGMGNMAGQYAMLNAMGMFKPQNALTTPQATGQWFYGGM